MVLHIPDTPKIVVISSNDELMEDPDEDSEKGMKFKEHHIDHEVEEAKSIIFDSSFDSAEEPEDDCSSG